MNRLLFLIVLYSLNSLLYALPKGFVYLRDIAPDIIEDMRYATANNFIGTPIPGYKHGVCIVTQEAAEQLRQAEKAIRSKGYTLKVYDCYRPQRAVNYFYKWSQNKDQRNKEEFYPRELKQNLFNHHYIALSSGHTRGSTLDLTLVPLSQKEEHAVSPQKTSCYGKTPDYRNDNSIDMGTRFDCLDSAANIHYGNLSALQKKNRALLKNLMMHYGFKPFFREWWHYTLNNEPYPNTYFNFPVR